MMLEMSMAVPVIPDVCDGEREVRTCRSSPWMSLCWMKAWMAAAVCWSVLSMLKMTVWSGRSEGPLTGLLATRRDWLRIKTKKNVSMAWLY